MKHLIKFNESLRRLDDIKIKIYESMDPPMVDVWEDWRDYLLELTDKYFCEFTDKQDKALDVEDLSLVVDIPVNSSFTDYSNFPKFEYNIATERDYFFTQGWKKIFKDPRDIPVSNKIGSGYQSSYDSTFLDLYDSKSEKLEPYYFFGISIHPEYRGGEHNWTEEETQEMTDELVNTVKRLLRRLGATIVNLHLYKLSSNEYVRLSSKNLDDIDFPAFKVGFKL